MSKLLTTEQDIIDAAKLFKTYLCEEKTIQKIILIDNELHSKYLVAIKDLLEAGSKKKLHIKFRHAGEIPSSHTEYLPEFKNNPEYNNIEINILEQQPSHVVGHELIHAIDEMTEMWYNREDGYPAPTKSRLPLLLDSENICTEDEYIEKLIQHYNNVDIEKERRGYKYITSPYEFAANLYPLIEFNKLKDREGAINFESAKELEEVLKDETMKKSWIYDIYYYLVKDKDRFIKTINKYAFLYLL